MNSIIYLGIDVHKETYTICCFFYAEDTVKHIQTFSADYKNILKYVDWLRTMYGVKTHIVCGYEAGCIGYSLYHQLTNYGLNCIILAPSTMAITNTNRVKTDKRDAGNIARCLAFKTYSEVYVPTKQDEAVKEFIRMRDSQKDHLKRCKQQILSYVLRLGFRFDDGSYWTVKHLKWLKSLEMEPLFKETLDEYLTTYHQLTDKIQRLDERIEEFALEDAYREKVSALKCFIGIKTHTALAIVAETGDFNRFPKAESYAAFLGLIPGESSSGQKQNRFSITKAGNSHLRTLLIESAQGYTRGAVGFKSKELKHRQKGNAPEIIAYADKGNVRLRRKYYRMTLQKEKKSNVAKVAIAREMSCFIWGMMTYHID